MPKEIFFFATKADMLNRLEEIELIKKIKYIKCGGYDSPNYIEFDTIHKVKNLGVNTTGNHQSESYLVLANSIPVAVREVKQLAGGVRYCIDQMLNQTSIVFWPSGIFDEDYLICGHIATISDEKNSLELYKLFIKAFVKGYKKEGRYYIGPEAFTLSTKMRFITMNVNQSLEYDLKVE